MSTCSCIIRFVFVLLFEVVQGINQYIMCFPSADHKEAMSVLMHSNEISKITNTDKIPFIVDLGVCPNMGAWIYDPHERRELGYDDEQFLDESTGQNRFNEKEPRRPHTTGESILQSKPSASRPEGVKVSTQLIR